MLGNYLRFFRLLILLGLVWAAPSVNAAVLDSIEPIPDERGTVIRINFSTVVRYQRHFPVDTGRTLEITIQFVRLPQDLKPAFLERKSLRADPDRKLPAVDVTLEKNGALGTRLILNFSKSVKYQVRQGKNNRSIDVILLKPAAAKKTKKYYAVTLKMSFDPIKDASKIASDVADIKGTMVYTTDAKALGMKTYMVRLGFFPSFDEAASVRDKLLAKYPSAWATVVEDSERLSAIKQKKALAAAKPKPPTTRPTRKEKPSVRRPRDNYPYVINLDSSLAPIKTVKPLPKSLRNRRVYTTEATTKGKTWHRLRMGFFANKKKASTALTAVKPVYPKAWIDLVSRQEKLASIDTALIAGSGKFLTFRAEPKAPVELEEAADGDLEKQMELGRRALALGKNVRAIRIFTKILQQPENEYTRDALELLGLARERNGQASLATVEYTLYLKRYPEGEGATRVRQRLAVLIPEQKQIVLKEPKKQPEATSTEVYGTLYQQYYRGNSQIDTTIRTTPTVVEQASLSTLDQKAVITNFDITGRFRNDRYDNRTVFSGEHLHDLLPEKDDDSNVSSAYVEIKDRQIEYSARIGRQSGTTGGVLGRFDGGLFGYRLSPKWGLNLVVGSPADTFAKGSDRLFYGTSLDLGVFDGHWSGNIFYIHQEVDELTDREAVGGELRYFSERGSFFSLLDYDLYYKDLNIFMFQGNWQSQAGTTYNLLLDYRNSPPLQTTNALFGESADTVSQLRRLHSDAEIKQFAQDRTPVSKIFSAGGIHPFNSKFQVGADLTVTNISGTPASGTVPETPGTGNVYTFAPKLIGSSLLLKNDVSVLSLAVTDSDTFDATSYALTTRVPFKQRWRVDLALKWYDQDNSSGTQLERFTQTARVDYRWKNNISFELEFTREDTETSNATIDENTVRDFLTFGYRWDF